MQKASLLSVIIFACTSTALQAADRVVADAQSLVDVRASAQRISAKDYAAKITLHKAINGQHDLELLYRVNAGAFVDGKGHAEGWNLATHVVNSTGNTMMDDTIYQSSVTATLQADKWVPKDKQPIPLSIELDCQLKELTALPPEPNYALEGRWWRLSPHAQGAEKEVTGTFTVTGPDGKKHKGTVSGHLEKARRPGKFDMGTITDDGLALHFDMGDKRANWNHARLAQIAFADGAKNCRDWAGIRIRLKSPKQRHDASVTIWLREADGSWYYIKDAVPLAAADNEAVLLWSDFEEAEWVAPSNHMDEDYQLDTSSIDHLGIGIVNPLGIGTVDFTLQNIELVKLEAVETPAISVHATGKTLDVNGQTVVPAALIGGFAPNLPAKYRPGCQRTLHFGLTGHPVIPRQQTARLSSHTIINGHALITRIIEQADAGKTSVSLKLWKKIDAKMQKKARSWLKKAPPAGDKKKIYGRNKDVANLLNRFIAMADLYDETSWTGIALSERIQDTLQAKSTRMLSPTELMELNRDLLQAAFPAHITSRPEYGPTEQFIIDCQGERLHPSTYVKMDNWEEVLHNLGKSYGTAAKKAGHQAVMEFWNEPYLNWAERSRIHFNVKLFRQDLAKEGGPVSVNRKDGSLDIIPHFKWVPARNKRVSQTKDGLMVIDESAFSYWSGKGNGYIYDKMYTAMASGIKQTDPNSLCIAGWGFRWHEDHWGAWDMLYKPTIDKNIDLIDGIHEHHYQGDTTDMVGSYEVLTAYGMTAHNKWLRCYNTECNDLVDAPARGAVDVPDNVATANTKDYRRAIYNLRDILYCIHQAPAKAAARTMIHWNHTPQGTDVCFTMLWDLRGRLLQTESSDPDIWCVASVDGTDPKAMPPTEGQSMTVIVFNNHRSSRSFPIKIDAPTGTSFTTGTERTIIRDPKTFAVSLAATEVTIDAASYAKQLTIPGRSAWKVSLPLTGTLIADTEVSRRQFFSPDILQNITPDKNLQTTIKLDPKIRAKASRAWLRLVVENVAPHEAAITIAGQEQPLILPAAYTRDNGNRIMMIPVEVSSLQDETTVIASCTGNQHAGYRIDMCSIVLETAGKIHPLLGSLLDRSQIRTDFNDQR